MKNPSVVIIKKVKKGGHGGHHGGAWKVAYADFVTAMMAFFLVMWLVAQSNAVKAAVAGYFRDPGIFEYEKSNSPIAGGENGVDPDAPPKIRTSDSKVVVGVGDANSLDVEAITTIGHFAHSPAIPLANFHMLEELFLQLVVQVSETVVGRTVQVGDQEFLELARVRQVNKIGIDYALVIGRSGSMDERC